MRVRVRFRFNASTGAVETFVVDDLGSDLPEAEHNRTHDGIAHEIGGVVERRPHIDELISSGAMPRDGRHTEPPTAERDAEPEERFGAERETS